MGACSVERMFDTEILSSDLDLLDPEHRSDDDWAAGGFGDDPPGSVVGGDLVPVDRNRLSGYDRVCLLKARARLSFLDRRRVVCRHRGSIGVGGRELDNLWEGDPDPQVVGEATASEIQAALH